MNDYTQEEQTAITTQIDSDLAKLDAGSHEVNASGELVEK